MDTWIFLLAPGLWGVVTHQLTRDSLCWTWGLGTWIFPALAQCFDSFDIYQSEQSQQSAWSKHLLYTELGHWISNCANFEGTWTLLIWLKLFKCLFPVIFFLLLLLQQGLAETKPQCEGDHTKHSRKKFTSHRSYIFLKVCDFFRVEWHLNKECLKYAVHFYVFGWNNFFEDLGVGWMLWWLETSQCTLKYRHSWQ